MSDEYLREVTIAVIEDDRILKPYLKRLCINFVKQVDNTRMQKKQAETILELQDQIRLLQFDISENKKLITTLKDKHKSVRKTMLAARDELENIKKNGNYEELDRVIRMFKELKEDGSNE